MPTSRLSFVAKVTSTPHHLCITLQDLRTRERITCSSWAALLFTLKQLLEEQQAAPKNPSGAPHTADLPDCYPPRAEDVQLLVLREADA